MFVGSACLIYYLWARQRSWTIHVSTTIFLLCNGFAFGAMNDCCSMQQHVHCLLIDVLIRVLPSGVASLLLTTIFCGTFFLACSLKRSFCGQETLDPLLNVYV